MKKNKILTIPIADATSMYPLLQNKDLAVIDLSEINRPIPGEVYYYREGSEFVLHRYHYLFFKGDNSLNPDAQVARKLFGKLVGVIRDGQFMAISPLKSGWPILKYYPRHAPKRVLRLILKIYLLLSLSPSENYSLENL